MTVNLRVRTMHDEATVIFYKTKQILLKDFYQVCKMFHYITNDVKVAANARLPFG
ncbi:MAG: hypothetical protein PHQ45_03480 [Acidaminococcaceae bacterium]|nr:hypothetical protein [Acidaminococcaceae bacterium]